MIIRLQQFGQGGGSPVSLRCPACGQIGTFHAIANVSDVHVPGQNLWLGQRRCPNPQCFAHVFCVLDANSKVLKSYPAQRIDFDPTQIPPALVKTFGEALTCHAESCFTAAAIMIRRCLEELCEDKQAKGDSLKARLQALQTKVVLPKELFDAFDDLRLLGNDAAHVEAKTYDSVGAAEVEAGIAVTKEILKAVYQLDDLVQRLRALRKP